MAATLVMATLLLNQMMPGRYFPAIPLVTSKDASDGAADYNVIAVLRDDSGVTYGQYLHKPMVQEYAL